MYRVFAQQLKLVTKNETTTQGGDDVVEEFREACGPADPEIARALYPDSIRALLGVNQVGAASYKPVAPVVY